MNRYCIKRYMKMAAYLGAMSCLLGTVGNHAASQSEKDTLLSKSRVVYDGQNLADDTWAHTYFVSHNRMLIFTLVDNKLNSIVEQHLNTGRSRRQLWLETEIRDNKCNLGEIHFSSDGRWLLWVNWDMSRREVELVDTERRRLRLVKVPKQDNKVVIPDTVQPQLPPFNMLTEDNIDEWNCAWAADSKKWFLLTAVRDPGGMMSVFSTHFTKVYACSTNDNSTLKYAYNISPSSPIRIGKGFPPFPIGHSLLDAANVMPSDILIVGGRSNSLGDFNSEVLDLNLKAGAEPVRTYMPQLPVNVVARSLSFSPDGKRIAWETAEFGGPNGTTAIYVSNIDCRQLKEVGHINGDGIANAIYKVRWLPDGKTLAFDYGKSTRTVPAD